MQRVTKAMELVLRSLDHRMWLNQNIIGPSKLNIVSTDWQHFSGVTDMALFHPYLEMPVTGLGFFHMVSLCSVLE